MRILRVLRGGSWILGARDVRCASRSALGPGSRSADLGLRLVADVRRNSNRGK